MVDGKLTMMMMMVTEFVLNWKAEAKGGGFSISLVSHSRVFSYSPPLIEFFFKKKGVPRGTP
jgi:hypothetical protein